MTDVKGSYRVGGLLFLILAALHIVALIVGVGQYWTFLLAGVIVDVLLAALLFRNQRWAAYMGFLVGLVGFVVAMGFAMNASGLFALALWAIAITDLLAAIALFGALWKSKPAKDALA